MDAIGRIEVRSRENRLRVECLECGAFQEVGFPVGIGMAIEMIDSFARAHSCPSPRPQAPKYRFVCMCCGAFSVRVERCTFCGHSNWSEVV